MLVIRPVRATVFRVMAPTKKIKGFLMAGSIQRCQRVSPYVLIWMQSALVSCSHVDFDAAAPSSQSLAIVVTVLGVLVRSGH